MSELQAFETVLGRNPKQAPIPLRVGAIDRKAKVKYGVWEGTKAHPVLVEMESYAIIVGNWAILPDGRKKSIKGKHFCVIKYYLEDKEIPESAEEKFRTIETYITW